MREQSDSKSDQRSAGLEQLAEGQTGHELPDIKVGVSKELYAAREAGKETEQQGLGDVEPTRDTIAPKVHEDLAKEKERADCAVKVAEEAVLKQLESLQKLKDAEQAAKGKEQVENALKQAEEQAVRLQERANRAEANLRQAQQTINDLMQKNEILGENTINVRLELPTKRFQIERGNRVTNRMTK